MIYTVTFNPSLDYIVGVPEFTMGKVNRTAEEFILPGGKGINVSIVLKNLGMDSVPLGFVAGFTGKEIQRRLRQENIEDRFIVTNDGISRINVKIRSLKETKGSKYVTEEGEINGMGPKLSEEAMERFWQQLGALEKEDILVLAGSIPSFLPDTIYRDVLEYLKEKDIRIVVDASNKLLVNVLEYHPFLIKPNNHELGEIFGVTIEDRDTAIHYAYKLKEMGARNVLVSMAGEGAVLVDENDKAYKINAPDGQVVNSVGAGDSMVAGFLYGYLKSNSYEDALIYGVCTGSASAFSKELAKKTDVERLLAKLS